MPHDARANSPTWTRREALRGLGLGLAAAAVACSPGADDTETGGASSTGGTDDDPTTGSTGTTDVDDPTTTTDPTTGDPVECGDPAGAWASGGTAAMTAKACYPDPFAGGVTACALICETTAGPCTADTVERQDVSEGFVGLPVRLALKIVDADICAPIAGAQVEIWHTQRTGVYSGETPSGQFCYGDDPDAANYLYFRGTQTTDADGRVDFDTCFPGWYPGRAIHIHFRVWQGGDNYATSQLFFRDELAAELFASHPDYQEFGQPDTTNVDDNIIGGETDLDLYLLDTARMPDGAMLAAKVIGVRGSLDDATCALGGMP
jgi:protocatechuate 3,4-dioxygenase beta subunit